MKIIVINGSAESGKDTFVKFFKRHSSSEVHNISSIDPVKELMAKCGWAKNHDKSDNARACMAEIKQILVDRIDGGFWYINQKIDEISYFNPDAVIFVHIREPEEIEKIKWAYGENCFTLIVDRDVRVPNNAADLNVEKYHYDFLVDNDGSIDSLDYQAMRLADILETHYELPMAA